MTAATTRRACASRWTIGFVRKARAPFLLKVPQPLQPQRDAPGDLAVGEALSRCSTRGAADLLRPLVLLAAGAVLLGGCGSAKPKSDVEQIRGVYNTTIAAARAKDWKKVCGTFAPDVRAKIAVYGAIGGTDTCEEALQLADAREHGADHAGELTSIVIRGSRATGHNSGAQPGTDAATAYFIKVGERWYADEDPGG